MGPGSKGIVCVWIGLGLEQAWALVAPKRQLENSLTWPCCDATGLWTDDGCRAPK